MPATTSISEQGTHKRDSQFSNRSDECSEKRDSSDHTKSFLNNVGETRQPQFSISSQSFGMFLIKSIEKIAGERETRKSQNGAIKKACEEALALLRERVKSSDGDKTQPPNDGGSHLPPLRSDSGILLTDERLLRPFQLACTMKSPKIVSTAIDSLQKLIAYGHIPNSAVCFAGKIRIIEQVVTTICSCFQGPNTDDGIQLQIMKALLTVITSSVVEVHEADILLIVRTCYNIFMATKNPVNQATARATLTQIINVIFQRMEQNGLEVAVMLNSMNNSVSCSKQYPDNETVHSDEVTEQQEQISNAADSPGRFSTIDRSPDMTDLKDESASPELNSDRIVQDVLYDLINQVVQHDKSTGNVLVNQLSTDSPTSQSVVSNLSSGQESSSNLNNLDWSATNNNESESINESDSNQSIASEVVTTAHITQKDAFLVFRSLCRLAVKDSTGPSSIDPKSHTVRSKTLSLQLLLNLLQQAGPLFSTSEIFIAAIKQYLCVALFKNGTSPVVDVFGLSVAIFSELLNHFKPYLKRQIEMFFKDVLLFTLESNKCSFEHKLIVIYALREICSNAQCLVDIYLNYDCDLSMTNIFEKLTSNLAKIAQGRNIIDQSSSASVQIQTLRYHGLECLVLILRCMTGWSQELYLNPESHATTTNNTNATTDSCENQVNNESSVSDTPATAAAISKADDDPDDFESRKAQKSIYESGIAIFNQNQTLRGLRLLQENGLLDESEEAVAKFLLVEERLSKTHVGAFLGENDSYNLRVMYAYVDQFEFTGKDFILAMREFLSGFRLPGEAQKIDRLMEKFAARYCVCNPGNNLFASADTAYVLAFSVIILTTDLHNSEIKAHTRMTKDDYIRMNRGINDSQDLPADYLAKIYDEIASCGLKLKSNDGHSNNLINVDVNMRNDFIQQNGELNDNLKESITSNTSEFTFATRREHIRPMFKLAWTPFLAAFSVGLQDCDALDITHMCLEGIRHAVRIACIFHMELERDAYVQALARFTLLLTTSYSANNLSSSSNNSSNNNTNNSNNSSGTAGGIVTNTINLTNYSYLPNGQPYWSNRRPLSTTTTTTNMSGVSSNFILGANSALMNIPTTSTTISNTDSMKQKNIDTIRVLISIAQTDGNYLGHAWLDILRCISQLESTHLITQVNSSTYSRQTPSSGSQMLVSSSHTNAQTIVTGSQSSLPNYISSNATNRRSTISSTGLQQTHSSSQHFQTGVNSPEPVAAGSLAAAMVDSKKAAVIQEVMCETGSQSVVVAVDKVFTGSVRLNGDAIVDFVKALCQVSREELNLPQPRTFSLQKLVEISYYNMGRIRLQWSRIWEHIGSHFTTAGRSPDEDVAEFVIDSLRQLSMKLIEKGELPNFHFQKEFLRPFVNILEEVTVPPKIQDMIVRCMYQLVHSQFANIRSGWSTIFAVFHLIASCVDDSIVKMAFETCHFTINEVFPSHLNVVVGAFQTLIKALAEFACNLRFPDTAMESIRLIRMCASTVSEHGDLFVLSSSQTVDQITPNFITDTSITKSGCGNSLDDEDQIWLKGWMPVLCELFHIINSCKLDVRTRALTIFFDILKTHGAQFKPLWWRETFAVIFRVFHHLRNSPLANDDILVSEDGTLTTIDLTSSSYINSERNEWLNTTCNHTLYSIVDIFTQFYEPLHSILLDDVYQQLQWCCLQEHEQLARSGTSCLETLILSNGKHFNEQIWESTVQFIVNLFKATVPHQLLTWRPTQLNEVSSNDNPGEFTKSVPDHISRSRLFGDLLNKCVVQYELIQTVDHILFFSSHSRNEDNYFLHKARELAAASYPAFATALKAINGTTKTTTNSDKSDIKIESGVQKRTSIEINNQFGINTSYNVNVNKWKWVYNCQTGNAKNPPQSLSAASPLNDNRGGMYAYMSPKHCLTLVHCLLESHKFAKTFNLHEEQRNILFQAGFKVKAKPNLLKQETHSLLCALRILFRLADEPSDVRDQADNLLDQVILEALSYYHGLVIDGHRHAWDTCLILIITRLINLSPVDRFHAHAVRLYPGFCDLVAMAGGISPQVAALIRLFLLRYGEFFRPLNTKQQQQQQP